MDDMFNLPTDLSALLEKDLTLSVARLLAGRSSGPVEYILELDRLAHEPQEQREARFGQILAELETNLVHTKKTTSKTGTSTAVYL